MARAAAFNCAHARQSWWLPCTLLLVTCSRLAAYTVLDMPLEEMARRLGPASVASSQTLSPFSELWRKFSEDPFLHPVNTTRENVLQDQLQAKLVVSVSVVEENVTVEVAGEKVYSSPTNDSWGFHVVALSPRSGRLLLRRRFLTGELSEGALLAACLAGLQPGTIVVLVSLLDAGDYLGSTERFLLSQLGMEGYGVGGGVALGPDFGEGVDGAPQLISRDELLQYVRGRRNRKTALKNISQNTWNGSKSNNEKFAVNDSVNYKSMAIEQKHKLKKTPHEFADKEMKNGTAIIWDGYIQTEDPAVIISKVPEDWPPQTKEEIFRGRVYAESAAIYKGNKLKTSNIKVTAFIDKSDGQRCPWHSVASMAAQRLFCSRYEGYGPLCRCRNPLIPAELRRGAESIEMKESIPVAMLTARKSYFFYRQLVNLLTVLGAAQTEILVLVDGYNRETVELAALFGLPTLVHPHEGVSGTPVPLNAHFRYSVHAVFSYYHNVSKAIVLEDDLLLSPDFISYFHQMAWLLDTDPSIYVVNAFSVNSCATVAADATRVRRSEMLPQFGWMVTRRWAEEVLPLWVGNEETGIDWDWWLHTEPLRRGRDSIVPEVSRTFHSGSSGAHVSGWMQGMVFSNMIYNQDSTVKLRDLHLLQKDKYEAFILSELLSAIPAPSDFDPCNLVTLRPNVPEGSLVMFVVMTEISDYKVALRTMARCLHTFPQHVQDQYRGLLQYTLTGLRPVRRLYVVGCPYSPYCRHIKNPYTIAPSPDAVAQVRGLDDAWRLKQALQEARQLRLYNHSSIFY